MTWKWNDDDQCYVSDCGRFEIERDGARWMLCDGDKDEVLDLDAWIHRGQVVDRDAGVRQLFAKHLVEVGAPRVGAPVTDEGNRFAGQRSV